MSDLERQLEELFMSDSRSRRVDQVNVPAPRRNRLGGPVFVGGVAMAALALIVAFSLLRGGPENAPASSPSPSGSAGVITSAAPSASVAPSASSGPSASTAPSATSGTSAVKPDAQHGIVTRGGSGGVVRTEASAAAVTALKTYRAFAVSKDGRRVAYIRESDQQLVTFDTATPDVQKTVKDFGVESPGGIVWSSDSNDELLVQVDKRASQPLGGVESSSLRAINVDTGATREIVRFPGAQLLPIVWHGSTNTGGAVETGDGGFAISYDYISGGTLKRSTFPQGPLGAFSIRSDADGGRVLAVGPFSAPRGVMWWPFDKFEEKRDLKPADGWDVSAAFWRAGTDEIVVFASPTVKGAPGPAPRIEAWTTNDNRRTVAEGAGPLATLRTDGTAAITTNWNVVDLVTGAITPMPPGDATQTPQFAVKF